MRGEIFNLYEKLNSEDQKVFRRWLWVNAVIGAILLAGLIALAVNVPDDKSETTDQHATIHHKLLALERFCTRARSAFIPHVAAAVATSRAAFAAQHELENSPGAWE